MAYIKVEGDPKSLHSDLEIDVWSWGISEHIDIDTTHNEEGCARLTRTEAIAAAKAILAHYEEDFNGYEAALAKRFRPLTEDECAAIGLETVKLDPDAPLTSEISYCWKSDKKSEMYELINNGMSPSSAYFYVYGEHASEEYEYDQN